MQTKPARDISLRVVQEIFQEVVKKRIEISPLDQVWLMNAMRKKLGTMSVNNLNFDLSMAKLTDYSIPSTTSQRKPLLETGLIVRSMCKRRENRDANFLEVLNYKTVGYAHCG